jgi:hypothetical protein
VTVAYCSVADVKQRLSGDIPTMSAAFDATIAGCISAVSAEIDREVGRARGETRWSFLADSLYGIQQVILSTGQTPPTGGTFTLSWGAVTTSAIPYNASAATIEDAIEALTGIGESNVSVTGPVLGPFTVTWAGTLTGSQVALTGDGSSLIPVGSVTVVAVVPGVSPVPSVRLFMGRAGRVRFLPIDSCVAVSSVVVYQSVNVVGQTLVPGTDVLPRPLQGTPINGLWLPDLRAWPGGEAGLYGVGATWGGFVAIPGDVRESSIIEATRSLLGARAGYNDSIGVTPWGSLVTSKAFTDNTWAMIRGYRDFGAGLR